MVKENKSQQIKAMNVFGKNKPFAKQYQNILKQKNKEEIIKKKKQRTKAQKFFCNLGNGLYYTALTTGLIATAFLGKSIYVGEHVYLKNTDNHIKTISSILNTDMGLPKNLKFQGIENYEQSIIALKPNITGKIWVYLEDIPENIVKNINESLKYFNDLFKYINKRYYFEVCDKTTFEINKALLETTIKFKMSSSNELGSSVHALNLVKPNASNLKRLVNRSDKNLYLIGSEIYLNRDVFNNFLNDAQQRYTIKHELMHALGLGDMYNNDYYNEISIMNATFSIMDNLSPNDLKILFTAYCEKFVENDKVNEEKVLKVKQTLDEYENWYYNKLYEFCKPSLGDIQDISLEDFVNKPHSFNFISNNFIINEDLTFTATYNNVVSTGKVIVNNKYVVLPNIKTENGTKSYILTKTKDNEKLNCYSFNYLNDISKPTVSEVNNSNAEGLEIILK